MNNRIIIAAAGSGKTTYLVSQALSEKQENILITTYTQANELEIRKKIIGKCGCIPSNITIQTWFSFLLQHGIKPYQNLIYDKDIKGVNQVNGISAIKYMNGKTPICYSESKEFERHYFDMSGRIFSDKISKLASRINDTSKGRIIDRISRLFPIFFIDEIQDMAGYDLEFIALLLIMVKRSVIVGDPRQATFTTNNLSKNSQFRKSEVFEFFKKMGKNVEIDTSSLMTNFRSNKYICEFSNQLYPDYPDICCGNNEITGHDGIFIVHEKLKRKYLDRYKPIQLRDSIKTKIDHGYPAMNFGESKGLTFSRTFVYPTKPMIEWIIDNTSELAETSRAKFYVAVTRAKNSVTFVLDSKNYDRVNELNKYSEFIE